MKKTSPPSEASSEKLVGSRPEKSLLLGWSGLALYIGLGIGLEALHALKVGFYLDPSNSARRLMWTLSHVHGTLFSLLLIALAFTSYHVERPENRARFKMASLAMKIGWLLTPVGFFLGGLQLFGGDPGWGIFLVPVGALSMLFGVSQVAWACRSHLP